MPGKEETTPSENEVFDFETDARDALYAKAEEAKPEPEEEAAPEEEAEESEASDEEEAAVEEEAQPEAEAEVETEKKTVPLEALHEARGKNKALRDKVKDLTEKLDAVLRDYSALASQQVASPESEDEYADPEVARLRKDVEDLKRAKEQMVKRDELTAKEREQQELEKQITQADQKLTEEGYPGLRYAMGAVVMEINKRVAEDEENSWLYSPEGWETVYKEMYPQIEASFIKRDKKDIINKKKDLKSKANLVGTPGHAEPKPKKVEDKSMEEMYADYVKDRAARFNQISGAAGM